MARGFTDFSVQMIRGDTHKIRFTVRDRLTQVVVDITNWSAFRFTVKQRVTDADAAALIVKTLGAGITKVDAANGLGEITVNPADTSTLGNQEYNAVADIQGVDNSSQNWTLARGQVLIEPDVSITSP
jgi:hypothetical protein